jgi:hypothetical protein
MRWQEAAPGLERARCAANVLQLLDICCNEGLMASYFPDGHWHVRSFAYEGDESFGESKSLRDAYIAYHKAAKEES